MLTKPYRVLSIQGHSALFCLVCNLYSFHPQDLAQKFCNNCQCWLDELPMDFQLPADVDGVRRVGRAALAPTRPLRPTVELVSVPLFQGPPEGRKGETMQKKEGS